LKLELNKDIDVDKLIFPLDLDNNSEPKNELWPELKRNDWNELLIFMLDKSSSKNSENNFKELFLIFDNREQLSSVKVELISVYQIFKQSLKIENF
jgi:hypothetical protein